MRFEYRFIEVALFGNRKKGEEHPVGSYTISTWTRIMARFYCWWSS